MATRRKYAAKAEADRLLLVPASLGSPLGILDVTTLQFLLTPSNHPAAPRSLRHHADNDADRPASSELARAYGVCSGDSALSLIRKQRCQRKPVPKKLTPMESAPPLRRGASSAYCQQNTTTKHARRRHKRDEAAHRRGLRLAKDGAAAMRWNGTTPAEDDATAAPRNPVVYPLAHPHNVDDHQSHRCANEDGVPVRRRGSTGEETKLRDEIQWIRSHFPVRRLANANCSLALRHELFAETLRTNLIRSFLRDALSLWKWVLAKQKELEASRLQAVGRLVATLEHVKRDQVAHRFRVWTEWVVECRDAERLAAATSIQGWAALCRQRSQARVNRTAMSVARALAVAVQQTTLIQRAYRGYAARRILLIGLEAASQIQRFWRGTKTRRAARERHDAALQLAAVYEHVQREQRLRLLVGRRHDRLARTIWSHWKVYAAWREQLVVDYVASLVDQVEFFAAVMSIQRHIRGYQCRFRMKRKSGSAIRVQRAWRHHQRRVETRQVRKMLFLSQNVAASCLQRTFQRNRERKRHRAVMQKSSRPMYIRALTQDASFRLRYRVPIVKSAVSVIQSTWRRHVDYERWKKRRGTAARRIQSWRRRGLVLRQWTQAVSTLLLQHHERRRHEAARRLQRWLRVCYRCKRTREEASTARQLVEMLTAAVSIQRYYRHKNDRWRSVTRGVLHIFLPISRAAAARIQRNWRGYAVQKHRLLTAFGDQNGFSIPRALSIQELLEFLTQQQRDHERRHAAARKIQKAQRQCTARRDGRLFLQRYQILFQKELERKQQRRIIHGFLAEKQHERAKKKSGKLKQPPLVVELGISPPRRSSASTRSPACPSEASAASSPTATSAATTPQPSESPIARGEHEAGAAGRDDSDVVKCWSDEFQCHFWYDARTGESTWC